MLKGKKILIGISGSIAAYKSILLVRLLVKAGAEVRVIMTPAAGQFVSPLVLSTLSGNPVVTDLVTGDNWENHVMLGRWADVFVMAPLSCNTLAKMANGLCDNILLAVYLSATCPVAAAPAMDEDMWHHPATRRNLEQLAKDGVHIFPVGHGELASGLFGDGRMAEPEEILHALTAKYFRTDELKGQKALVTAGPTYEAIDPVRFIGNHSSGKMGFALAASLYLRGADVVLVSGPTAQQLPYAGIAIKEVTTAAEMLEACKAEVNNADIVVMAAAVADYRPVEAAPEKIKKKEQGLTLELTKTEDILAYIGQHRRNDQFIAGFALETEHEREHALEKMKKKNTDCIILNSLRDTAAGFGFDTNQVTILHRSGDEQSIPLQSKKTVADEIVSFIIKYRNEK